MTTTMTARELQLAGGTQDWRVVGRDACAWFGTGSHAAGAALVQAVVERARAGGHDIPDLDVRRHGVRVRIRRGADGFTAAHVEAARAVSEAAAALGLTADPAVLQHLQIGIDAMDAGTVLPFWEQVLGYEPHGDDALRDPDRRQPAVWFQQQDAPRPLRNRLHLDVVRPRPATAATVDSMPSLGATRVVDQGYHALVADADGNEADVLPLPEGGDRWDAPGAEDWRLVFAAQACYPTGSPLQAADLVEAVAALADEAGVALGLDVRGGSVWLDTGKDAWETDDAYAPFAARAQEVARGLGLTADTGRPRFVQVGIDAVDVPAVREFWRVALGYAEDPRPHVTDVVDPRGLGIPVFFQPMEADDQDRRAQRNRIHVDLFVADDQARTRVDAALAAGGRLTYHAEAPEWWTVADPEGNELCFAVSPGREEIARGEV